MVVFDRCALFTAISSSLWLSLLLYFLVASPFTPATLPSTTCGAMREEFCVSLRRYREGDGVIWFQHLHKAGGTMMCLMALSNVAISNQKNCNPLNASGEHYRLWTASADEQRAIALETGSKFIANERWMAPDRVPAGDMFTYITAIRDPLDRWLSNAYFELAQPARLTDAELFTLMDRAGFFADNLAVRAFSGKPTGGVTAMNLETAKAVLRDFTIVIPTELYPLARVLLQELLGWNWTTLYMHENTFRISSGLVRGSKAREELSPNVLSKLIQRERFDLELYDYAVRLFLEQLAAWSRSSASPFYASAQQSLLSDRKLISGEFTATWMAFMSTREVRAKVAKEGKKVSFRDTPVRRW